MYNTLTNPNQEQQYSYIEEENNESETIALHYSERGSQGNRIILLQNEMFKSQSAALALRNQQTIEDSRESEERMRTNGSKGKARLRRILVV